MEILIIFCVIMMVICFLFIIANAIIMANMWNTLPLGIKFLCPINIALSVLFFITCIMLISSKLNLLDIITTHKNYVQTHEPILKGGSNQRNFWLY